MYRARRRRGRAPLSVAPFFDLIAVNTPLVNRRNFVFFFVFVASVYRAAGKSRASSLHVRAQPRRRRWVHGEAAGSGPALHGVLCRAACFVFLFLKIR